MTRINVVPVEELTRQHLIAEYRELPRIFALIRQSHARGEKPTSRLNPTEYCLGTGHVRFFYNKISWLVERFKQLVDEMDRRGYKAVFRRAPDHGLPMGREWHVPYEPKPVDLAINRVRIADRLGENTA